MKVKVQLFRDDGTLVYEMILNATAPGGWETDPFTGPVVEGGQKLYGMTYLPCPPPRDPMDMAEFRRLLSQYF